VEEIKEKTEYYLKDSTKREMIARTVHSLGRTASCYLRVAAVGHHATRDHVKEYLTCYVRKALARGGVLSVWREITPSSGAGPVVTAD